MKIRTLVTLLTFLLPSLVWAQENKKELSLQQAVECALKYNKTLQSSKLDIDLRQQMIRESVSQGLPQLNGSMKYSSNFGENMDFGGNAIKMEDQLSASVTLSQLLFSGEWIVGVQTSKIAKQISEQQVDMTEADIKESVYNTYYSILVVERLIAVLEKNVENINVLLRHTEDMYNAGTVEITDVDQMRINANQLKNSIASMKRNLDVNYNLLRLQLGADPETILTLTDNLDTFLVQDVFDQLNAKEFNMGDNLQYKLVESQEKLQQKMVSLKKWAYAPSISGSYTYLEQIEGGFMSIPHTANITLNVPLFSGMKRKAQLKQAQLELEQIEINKSLLEDNLNLQHNQYKYALENAIEDFNLQSENIRVAEKVLDNYNNKYKVGAISSLQYTQANTNFLDAQNSYTSACLTLLQAKVQLEKLYNSFK